MFSQNGAEEEVPRGMPNQKDKYKGPVNWLVLLSDVRIYIRVQSNFCAIVSI